MNRIDTKYVTDVHKIGQLLEIASKDYQNQDTSMLKVYYELPKGETNDVDTLMKLPKEQ